MFYYELVFFSINPFWFLISVRRRHTGCPTQSKTFQNIYCKRPSSSESKLVQNRNFKTRQNLQLKKTARNIFRIAKLFRGPTVFPESKIRNCRILLSHDCLKVDAKSHRQRSKSFWRLQKTFTILKNWDWVRRIKHRLKLTKKTVFKLI